MFQKPKQNVPYSEYRKVVEEAQVIADLVNSRGWKLLEADMLDESGRIAELLTENKLRTVEETVETKQGKKTFITTLESQLAEMSGKYQMVKWILNDIHMKMDAPNRMIELERQGVISIDKAKEDKRHEVLTSFSRPVPAGVERLRRQINEALSKRG